MKVVPGENSKTTEARESIKTGESSETIETN